MHRQVTILRDDYLAAPVACFLAALVLCGGVIVGIANRILRLADGRLNFALDLLNCASNLGPSVAGQVSGMPLCASHHCVDCALYSLLVHFSTSWVECSSARQAAGLYGTQRTDRKSVV